MLAIQITLNVYSLIAVSVLCLLAGLVFNKALLNKKNHRVMELEKEMLKSHAEIIELYRQIDFLKTHDSKTSAPVFKLKDGTVNEEDGNSSDVSPRKKLLGKTSGLK